MCAPPTFGDSENLSWLKGGCTRGLRVQHWSVGRDRVHASNGLNYETALLMSTAPLVGSVRWR